MYELNEKVIVLIKDGGKVVRKYHGRVVGIEDGRNVRNMPKETLYYIDSDEHRTDGRIERPVRPVVPGAPSMGYLIVTGDMLESAA